MLPLVYRFLPLASFIVSTLLSIITVMTPVAASAAEVAKPNILILLADDFGYNDSGIYQDVYQQKPVAAMPALLSLANSGIRFTRFYTESTCSTSRAALLTGQYPARQAFTPVARGISSDVLTLPEYLKSQGYVTHHVGKWHVGEINRDAFPANQGFDSSFGFLGQWFLKGPDANGQMQLKTPTYKNPWLVDEQGHYRQYAGHLEDILTQHTLALIKDGKSSQQPWFIYHAFFAPHTPLEPAERFAQQFDRTPEGKYKALLAQLDDNLAQIFSALKESGQWDNTIIIFASDNGSPGKEIFYPELYPSSNAPFEGGKAEYEEGGMRTPLVIKWQASKEKQTRNDVVSIMDIFPSLAVVLENHEIDATQFDGLPSLLQEKAESRQRPLYFLSFGSLSVLDAKGEYRLFKQWSGDRFTDSHLYRYSNDGIPVDMPTGFFETLFHKNQKTGEKLYKDFLAWRNSIRQVPVTFERSGDNGSGKLVGRNFLRTPINTSYAIAFSFAADSVMSKQMLLYQKDVMEVLVENGELMATVYGLQLKENNIHPGQCYRVVLSGSFADRFTSVRKDIFPSILHLIVDGKEVHIDDAGPATGTIDSLEQVDVSSPTYVGINPENPDENFSGTISQPQVFSSQLLPDDKPIESGFDQITTYPCSK